MAKAIGEAVERYCAACYEMDEFPFTSYDEATFECVLPEDFALYSDQQYASGQFPYSEFTRTTRVRWTPSVDWTTGETCYVPAAMVYLPYFYRDAEGERAIAQPISTGLACHSSFKKAAISAICEVIERDAFTIMWQGRISPPRIRLDSVDQTNSDLINRFEKTGNQIALFNLTTDCYVPTVMAVSRGQHDAYPAMVVAASSDLDPEQAVRKAIEELAHTWQLARDLKTRLTPIEPTIDFKKSILHQDDHILLYCDSRNSYLAKFLWESSNYIDVRALPQKTSDNVADDFKLLIDKIRQLNHRVLLADVTTPDVSELGLSVVRAIIPGFHPLFMGHRFRALGGTRLWEVPTKLGLDGVNSASGDNQAPHPYP
jgi:ribosomal protein S12 methylthiotransferase accessory factor